MRLNQSAMRKLFLSFVAASAFVSVQSAKAETCQRSFEVNAQIERGITFDEAIRIAKQRATDSMLSLLAQSQLADLSNRRVLIDLVQDQSHLSRTPAIPSFVLTLIARKAFAAKFAKLQRADDMASQKPRLKKMWFAKTDESFRGQTSQLQAHTLIEVQIKDVEAVLAMFVRSMYHPSLGNKVFKIDLKSNY